MECPPFIRPGRNRRDLTSWVRDGRERVMISYGFRESHPSILDTAAMRAYLERLRIPILDLFDRRHITESIGQFAQVLDPMRQADGELLG